MIDAFLSETHVSS